MSIESAQAFIERMKTDEEFAKNVIECKDAESCITYVNDAGFDFSKEELVYIKGELSDGELDMVAGGYVERFKEHYPADGGLNSKMSGDTMK